MTMTALQASICLLYYTLQNKELLSENSSLKQRTECLEAENRQLQQQLAPALLPGEQLLELQALVKESLLESVGSAAPSVSLQQKRTPAPSLGQTWMLR